MSVKLDDDMVAIYTTYGLVVNDGMTPKDAVALYGQWLNEQRAEAYDEGYHSGWYHCGTEFDYDNPYSPYDVEEES